MDVPDWVAEGAKVGVGAVVGVFAGQRRLEKRVTTLEASRADSDRSIKGHDEKIESIHRTVEADHDLLTKVASNVELILGAMQLRAKS